MIVKQSLKNQTKKKLQRKIGTYAIYAHQMHFYRYYLTISKYLVQRNIICKSFMSEAILGATYSHLRHIQISQAITTYRTFPLSRENRLNKVMKLTAGHGDNAIGTCRIIVLSYSIPSDKYNIVMSIFSFTIF